NFLLTSTLHGCLCLYVGETYIRQYPAPMAIYPLRVALGGIFHFLIAIVMVVLLSWVINGLGNLWVLPFLVVSALMLSIVTWPRAVTAGLATVYFRDTERMCEGGFQIFFSMTRIFSPESLPRAQPLAWLAGCTPARAMSGLVRKPILYGELPSAGS